ncbi:MAG TPA: hypothetical protein VGU61_10905 [Noviherbaspirillum sp.]|jgi:hypothetical protein|uniref:hypothetical protein n=1 Tax=Noviherbaspirillum sp. TaxID=1926288 RepID=UPI002DDD3F07|nr:hypothetical protein [Noviherbaspirillum sp.]HEV2610765.1 hypothetical protein [Noviherbaspirillum sp.]
MNISTEMIDAATAKAVEAGLFPRRALKEEHDEARAIMLDILQTALNMKDESMPRPVAAARPSVEKSKRLVLVYARS